MELIDKDAVVARLEEKLKSLQKEYNELVREEYWIDARNVAPRIDEIKNIISLISNFGGKEADLVKESKDYKQKYEEALKRAEDCHIDGLALSQPVKEVIELIFPELKKSENELIREEILNCFVGMKKQGCFPSKHKEQYDSWISWLEKQGKQEQLYIRFGEIPTDEISKIYRGEIEVGTENGVSVYPAFKTDEGDIVLGLSLPITKTTLYTQQQLIEYGDRPCYLVKGNYVGKDTDGQPLINNVSVIEKIDNYRVKEEKQGDQKLLNNDKYQTVPVKILDRLYESEKELEQLKQSEQKPAWSEDDEKMKSLIISTLTSMGTLTLERYHHMNLDEVKDWLKSIKDRVQPQPKQGWSEEDEISYSETIAIIESWVKDRENDGFHYKDAEIGKQSIDWLKSLKPSHWKPSEYDISLLEEIARNIRNNVRPFCSEVSSLEDLIKNLKTL